jgi:hypothetical protein
MYAPAPARSDEAEREIAVATLYGRKVDAWDSDSDSQERCAPPNHFFLFFFPPNLIFEYLLYYFFLIGHHNPPPRLTS